MPNRPLSHLRVLDFGHYLAAPLVGMMLADLGAEVIRIDPPGGPRWRDPAFDMLSRGKRALTQDLRTDEGRRMALLMVTIFHHHSSAPGAACARSRRPCRDPARFRRPSR